MTTNWVGDSVSGLMLLLHLTTSRYHMCYTHAHSPQRRRPSTRTHKTLDVISPAVGASQITMPEALTFSTTPPHTQSLNFASLRCRWTTWMRTIAGNIISLGCTHTRTHAQHACTMRCSAAYSQKASDVDVDDVGHQWRRRRRRRRHRNRHMAQRALIRTLAADGGLRINHTTRTLWRAVFRVTAHA